MMQRLRHVSSSDVMVDNVLWAAVGTMGILFGSTLLEVKTLGRKRTLAIGLSGCAVTYLAFALARDNAVMVAVSCVNNLANNLGWGALFTYTAEVHPTELRALGCGCANMIKSLAGIFGPYFAGLLSGVDPNAANTPDASSSGVDPDSSGTAISPDGAASSGITIALTGFFVLDMCACVASLLLPVETRGVVLAESVQEAQSVAKSHSREGLSTLEQQLPLLGSTHGDANVTRV